MNSVVNFPELKFESFFNGKVEAKGHIVLFYPKKKTKNIKATFTGTYKKNILMLKEEYYDNDTAVIRNWKFNKISNHKFKGYEKNILKPFNCIIKENYLEMNYTIKTGYKNLSFYVNVKDQMYLIDKTSLVNKSVISKFYIPIAETILFYKKL
jgi:hypothetical protein